MQNQLMVFENKSFGIIRIIEIDGQPWFVGKDVAGALGYGDGKKSSKSLNNAVSAHVDEEDKGVTKMMTPGGMQPVVIVNESGLYALMLKSKLQAAKAFKRWVTSEILPSIRRHGAYIAEETMRRLREGEECIGALLERLADEGSRNSALLEKVDALEPKARYHDKVLQCENAIQASVIAKDYGMPTVAFNKLLHGLGIQFKIGDSPWLLYQEHAGQGYTLTRTYHVNECFSRIHTYWTQKGRWFLYCTLRDNGILPVAERAGCPMTGGACDFRQ